MYMWWLGQWASIATCYGLDSPISVEVRFSGPIQTGPEAHPASCMMGTGSLSQGQSDCGVVLTTYLFLSPGSSMDRAIDLLPPFACVACYRTAFTVTYWFVDTSGIFWFQFTALLYPSTVQPVLSLPLPNRFQFPFFPTFFLHDGIHSSICYVCPYLIKFCFSVCTSPKTEFSTPIFL